MVLPSVIAGPVALATLRYAAQRAGWIDTETGVVVMTLTTVVLLAAVVLWAARSLGRTDRARREALEALRVQSEVVANAGIGVAIWELDESRGLRLASANPAALEGLAGSPYAMTIGKTFREHYELPELERTFVAVAEGGPAQRLGEIDLDVEGDARCFAVQAFPLPGRRAGVAFEDVSERRRAEQEVVRAKDAALAAQSELEAFSYSVSHDLRAPLRGIDGFSQALLEDYDATLDETGKDYLRRIRAGVQRMGVLIDDLLELARVARAEMRREEVDLSAMVDAIAADLREAEPARDVVLEREEGVVATGDPKLLDVVLRNLLTNAWKFTSKRERAQVRFGTRRGEQGEDVFYVTDDGAGFDPAHADKLFGAFQRLHAAREFPGNGVGLATVRRVVSRHGGRVWAEGAVGRGATFSFTLGGGDGGEAEASLAAATSSPGGGPIVGAALAAEHRPEEHRGAGR